MARREVLGGVRAHPGGEIANLLAFEVDHRQHLAGLDLHRARLARRNHDLEQRLGAHWASSPLFF